LPKNKKKDEEIKRIIKEKDEEIKKITEEKDKEIKSLMEEKNEIKRKDEYWGWNEKYI
jgi:hypothetical protein